MGLKLFDRILALGNLLSHVRLAYIETDNNLQVSSWNKGAGTLFGYSENHAMGRFLNELIPVDEHKFQTCKQTHSFICSHVKPDRREIQCDMVYAPIISTTGEKVGCAFLARDITKKLKIQNNLKKQNQHLQAVFDFAPIGIYHVNMEGNISSANPEFAWMLGYESSEEIVDQITDFATQIFFDEKDADKFLFGLYEAEEVIRFRCRLKKQDNSFVWALCYAKATHNRTGRMDGFTGFSINISATVRAEQGLQKANEKLKTLSMIDGLTQIPNRRRFDDYFESEWQRHYRDKKPISIIMCDIDFFKLFNDNYGHLAGDECLHKVAQAINDSIKRPADLAARYGGEEFVIVLPDTDNAGAMTVAERVRTRIKALGIAHEKSKTDEHVTLSLGVASMVPGIENFAKDLLAGADRALYEAKKNGRNQSISATDL